MAGGCCQLTPSRSLLPTPRQAVVARLSGVVVWQGTATGSLPPGPRRPPPCQPRAPSRALPCPWAGAGEHLSAGPALCLPQLQLGPQTGHTARRPGQLLGQPVMGLPHLLQLFPQEGVHLGEAGAPGWAGMRQHDCRRVASLTDVLRPPGPRPPGLRGPQLDCAAPPLLSGADHLQWSLVDRKQRPALGPPPAPCPAPDISAAPSSLPELPGSALTTTAGRSRQGVEVNPQTSKRARAWEPQLRELGLGGRRVPVAGWAGGEGSGVPRGEGSPSVTVGLSPRKAGLCVAAVGDPEPCRACTSWPGWLQAHGDSSVLLHSGGVSLLEVYFLKPLPLPPASPKLVFKMLLSTDPLSVSLRRNQIWEAHPQMV